MSTRTIISDVTVVDVRAGKLRPASDLLIENGVIVEIGPTGSIPRRGDDGVIEPGQVYVVPGFVDMHAHVLNLADPTGTLDLMLASGITGFRQMSGTSELLRKRAAGTLPMPPESPALVALCGEILSPANAATPEQAAATVRAESTEGVDFIKIAAVGPEAFAAAQAEASALGLPIAGHLPAATDPRDAARLGFTIEHLGPGIPMLAACSTDEAAIRAELAGHAELTLPPLPPALIKRLLAVILPRVVVNPVARASDDSIAQLKHAIDTFDESKARDLARLFAAQGTWITPTLIRQMTSQLADTPSLQTDPNLRFMSEKTLKFWKKSAKRFAKKYTAEQHAIFHTQHALEQRLVKIFDEEGVRMLTGSDATGAGWVIPGPSLHQEFDLLAEAGLSPLRVLQMATLRAAEFLGTDGTTGAVEPGHVADLVFLSADPLASTSNLHSVVGVVCGGRHHSSRDLRAIEDHVAAHRWVG